MTMVNDTRDLLPLHVQKAIVGRLLGFEVLAPQLPNLELDGHKDVGARLSAHLCWLTNEALGEPDSQESLGSFLTCLVGNLRDMVARFHSDTAREAAVAVLEEIANRVKLFRDKQDNLITGMIKAVSQTAADFYMAYGATIPPSIWEHVSIALSFLGGREGLSFAPYVHLQVRTEFISTGTTSARVVFKVIPVELDIVTIASIPRVLLHEYIAHIPQGPHPGPREHPDANDAFAEGWMDYVAHRVHRAALERQTVFEALSGYLALTWTSIYEDAAERFFGARCELQDSDPAAAARCLGARAARSLHDLMRTLPETKLAADEYFYRLSIGLNASDLDSISRRRVAAEVLRCLLRGSRLELLVTALREWVSGSLTVEDLSLRLLA